MDKKIQELLAKQRELNAKIVNAKDDEERKAFEREYAFNKNEIDLINQRSTAEHNAPAQREASKESILRQFVKAVREQKIGGEFQLQREDSQLVITSSQLQEGDLNNMFEAGIPLTIKELVNPLEMGLIYDKLGIKIATGVRGNIQWPCLDTMAEVSVGGELDEVDDKTLDFSKITVTPVKLGIAIAVSNEAINDESFDLRGTIISEMNKAVGRVLNKRVLALSKPSVKVTFCGPLVAHAQEATYAGDVPTYKELKRAKGLVLGTGAQMTGFCYVMDAAMFSALEATPKDQGSGRFIIEGGKIDGDTIFLTNLPEYAGKVIAGCFGYEALNQHGATSFIVDPYTLAKKNAVQFVLNADWSLTLVLSSKESKYPFVILKPAEEPEPPTISGDEAISAPKTSGNAKRTYSVSDGSAITATVEEGKSWLTATVGAGNKVTFAWEANSGEAAPEREAEVTLATANGGELVVTVTQAANA